MRSCWFGRTKKRLELSAELTSLEQRNKYLHLTEINGQIMIQYLLLSSLYQKKKKRFNVSEFPKNRETESRGKFRLSGCQASGCLQQSWSFSLPLIKSLSPIRGLIARDETESIRRPTGLHYDGQAECQIAAAILFVPEMLTNCQCAPSTASQTAFKASCKSLLPSRAFTRAVHLKSRQSLDR